MTLADHLRLINTVQAGPCFLPAAAPVDDLRQGLQKLIEFEHAHPAVWQFSPELRAVERHLWRAVWALLLDVDHVVIAVAIDPNEKGT